MRKFDRDRLVNNIPCKNALPKEIEKFQFLDIEIGAGTGMFAIDYAEKNKSRALISIEKTSTKFKKFKNVIKEKKLSNLFSFHDNGVSWCAHNLVPNSVDRFFFLYPNPNPKKSDLNKRFHAMPFMGFVKDCLKSDGEIFFATNELFYYQEALDYMTKEWGLKLRQDKHISSMSIPLTLFEKKYLERGQTCYHFSFVK